MLTDTVKTDRMPVECVGLACKYWYTHALLGLWAWAGIWRKCLLSSERK